MGTRGERKTEELRAGGGRGGAVCCAAAAVCSEPSSDAYREDRLRHELMRELEPGGRALLAGARVRARHALVLQHDELLREEEHHRARRQRRPRDRAAAQGRLRRTRRRRRAVGGEEDRAQDVGGVGALALGKLAVQGVADVGRHVEVERPRRRAAGVAAHERRRAELPRQRISQRVGEHLLGAVGDENHAGARFLRQRLQVGHRPLRRRRRPQLAAERAGREQLRPHLRRQQRDHALVARGIGAQLGVRGELHVGHNVPPPRLVREQLVDRGVQRRALQLVAALGLVHVDRGARLQHVGDGGGRRGRRGARAARGPREAAAASATTACAAIRPGKLALNERPRSHASRVSRRIRQYDS